MIGVAVLVLIVLVAIISVIADFFLGVLDDSMHYDWHTERWVFVPTRYDVALDIMIRS